MDIKDKMLEAKPKSEKQLFSKSPLYGYRKPVTDEYGEIWCNCASPTLRQPRGRGLAYCVRCDSAYYH